MTAPGASSTDPVRRIVIVGGGTAGWLAAGLIAARADRSAPDALSVTVIESPDVKPIGVGEGTWPTMRGTLAQLGIAEADFLSHSDGAFKQGTRFDGWRDGTADDRYFHPFTAPTGSAWDGLAAWRARPDIGYAEAVSPQPAACLRDLAPRQRGMDDYAGALNYAYHFDAGKFGQLLQHHAVRTLGVAHVEDHVEGIEAGASGWITALRMRGGDRIEGDLFIDCTGQKALLIGGHCKVPWEDRSDILFNDGAIAVQMPSAPDRPIASQTNATAHEAGWIWDIGLPGRRGIGCVYASRFLQDDAAEDLLANYVRRTGGSWPPPADRAPRRVTFPSGHRARFWDGNCLAIGLSAGFLEPLEASAIVLVELSVGALLADFPRTSGGMAVRADRFNRLFRYRWDQIVHFLKLHYVLSRRPEAYWRAHRDPATIPPALAEWLELWRDRPPGAADFSAVDELFPAESYRYILYGMGFPVPEAGPLRMETEGGAAHLAGQVAQRTRVLAASLPPHRDYFNALSKVATHGRQGT